MKKVDLIPYEFDASNIKGKAINVVLPKTISEVKDNVKRHKKICIRCGATGLCGGAVPQNEVVIDLSKLSHIGEINIERKTVEVEAGVILDDLQNYLEEFNLEFPVNPSSHTVCTIGGMIATDAVGSRAILYGRTSQWVRWIEVIDANGNLTRKGTTEISDYAGLEGITGIIVKACLNLTEKKERTASLMPLDDLNDIIKVTKEMKQNSKVSMVELINPFISQGIGLDNKYHLIIEFEDQSGLFKKEKYQELMNKRDNIYPFIAEKGFSKIEDPKILIDKIKDLFLFLEKEKIPYFGHLSVGLIHPCFNQEQENLIPLMMKLVKRLGGQISGEHGIGLTKKQFVDPQDKKILINIKKRTDPQNKFNSNKIIDL